MKKELQEKLVKLFGIENLEKVCRLKVINNKLRSKGGATGKEYDEHEKLLEELENVVPRF